MLRRRRLYFRSRAYANSTGVPRRCSYAYAHRAGPRGVVRAHSRPRAYANRFACYPSYARPYRHGNANPDARPDAYAYSRRACPQRNPRLRVALERAGVVRGLHALRSFG